jgi:acyl-CoA synthetase (AMP-forming)/AMP-acid ligase II
MFDSFVTFRARLEPRATALITPGARSSFAELDARVDKVAATLAAEGLSPASGVVAMDVADAYNEMVLLLALARLRVASTPGYDARADLRFSLDPAWFDRAYAADRRPIEPAPADPEGLGRVLLSSGTTTAPRRVGLTWRMIEANVRNAASLWCAGLSGRWAPATGIDSMMGFMTALTAWATGSAVATGWGMDGLPALIEEVEPSFLAFTPAHLRELLRRLPADFRPRPGLRLLVGGTLLPRAVAQEARLRLTPDLRIIYGSTECSAMAHFDAARLEAMPGAAGYPGPDVRVEILDEAGALLPRGEVGEVRIVCPRSAQAYIGDAEASARTFKNGGFHPGDLGRLTPEGLLVLEGRIDDRMSVGGRKIMPYALEEAALACPGVTDAAAFAAPDDQGIDQLYLAVVQGEGFERERLVAALQGLPGVWPPTRFAWIAEIPRNAMGKVERARLRSETMAALGLAEA